jgi:hypothetical protein
MTTPGQQGQPHWSDLTQPAGNAASTAVHRSGQPPIPRVVRPRTWQRRSPTPHGIDRTLRSHVLTNATLACVYAFLAAVFGWAAAELGPDGLSRTVLAAASLACSSAVAAIPLLLAAILAARTARHEPAPVVELAAIWLTRLNLGAAIIAMVISAVISPSSLAFTFIPAVLAANGWVFLLNTRDAIRQHACADPRFASPSRPSP